MRRFSRFACIDWSGARSPFQRGIAVAVCEVGDSSPRLSPPPISQRRWSRDAILDWLSAHANDDMLIGVDFSPSLPFADRGAFLPGVQADLPDARALWAYVDSYSIDSPHLACTGFVDAHRDYFRVGQKTGAFFPCENTNGRMRETERRARALKVTPYSCFNLVGASQVGRSSLTGMRLLSRLKGRVPIWPFDPVPQAGALLVEIYTSIAAREAEIRGGSKMRSVEALNMALAAPAIGSAPISGSGPIDDHATDALLTAAWLRRAAERVSLWRPEGIEPLRQTEGWTFGVT